MRVVQIEKNQAGQRLDKFLHKYLPEAPNSFLYKMLRKKNITLNHKKAEGREILSIGDEVKFFLAEDTLEKFSARKSEEYLQHSSKNLKSPEIIEYNLAKEITLASFYIQTYQHYQKEINQKETNISGKISILYEDDHVLIINKPSGILTQKAKEEDISLNEWMIGYLLCSKSITPKDLETFHPSVCNRLDRNTSGLVLCGKSLAGSQALSEVIRNRSIHKYYRTIVSGVLKEAAQIEGVLYKENQKNIVTITNINSVSVNNAASILDQKENFETKKGNFIQTAYVPIYCSNNATYLEAELITGKTHQIRAHLASIGHPLYGDSKYGNFHLNQTLKKQYHLNYQLLHAFRLEFPILEGALKGLSRKQIIAPLPPLFLKILENTFDTSKPIVRSKKKKE